MQSSDDQGAGKKTPDAEKAAIDTLEQVKGINDANATTANPSVTSNAANFQGALDFEVNPRTGTLQICIAPPSLSGFFGGNITPSIFYAQSNVGSGRQLLGLPIGWSYLFSYIADGRIYINGEQSYALDVGTSSGMQYYKLENAKLHHRNKKFPYDESQQYTDVLEFNDGTTQYFDVYGRLIGMDDRFGNHVKFYYHTNAGVYNSRLAKIVNSHGQEITITPVSSGLEVAYPAGAGNAIKFTYLVDPTSFLLTGYKDPLGRVTIVTNNGGNERRDLISKIEYPNGVAISYDYTAVKAKVRGQSSINIDAVLSTSTQYGGEARIVKYKYYDPQRTHHGVIGNYTGYPKYSLDSNGQDPLLQSGDNEFRYVTQVDDGIFVTEYYYNFLHLELEKKIYSKASPGKLLNHAINTYCGQDEKGYFPPYDRLPLNYQEPKCSLVHVYNNQGEKRTYKNETDLDDYGNLVEIKEYQSNSNEGEFTIRSRVVTVYDYDNYGLILRQDVFDYTSGDGAPSVQPVIRRLANTLTASGKNIQSSINGFVVMDGNSETFKASKMVLYDYDDQGRVIFQELKWMDGQSHELESTKSSAEYVLNGAVLMVTHTDAQDCKSIIRRDAVTGWLLNTTNPLGATVSYTYDDLGRMLSEVDPLGVSTNWVYDDKLNKVTTKYANGFEIYKYYDGFGNMLRHADNLGENGGERTFWCAGYNDKGQRAYIEGVLGEKSRISFEYDDRGLLVSETNALGDVIRHEADVVAQDERIFLNNQRANAVWLNDKRAVNGLSLSSSRPGKKIYETSRFNAYQRVISTTLGDKAEQAWRKAWIGYDIDLHVSSFRQEGSDKIVGRCSITRDLFGNTASQEIAVVQGQGLLDSARSDVFVFNNLNRLVQERNNLGQKYEYTYDAAGRLIACKDYTSTVFQFSYYMDGQVASEVYVGKDGVRHETRFDYYPLTHALHSVEAFRDGKSTGKMQYTYTLDDKIESVTYPDSKKVSYSYNRAGLLSQFTDVLGQTTQYDYDDYGRLEGARMEGTAHAISISYYTLAEDPSQSAQIKSVRMSNGVEYSYRYTGYGQVVCLTTTDKNGNVLLKVENEYDDVTQNIVMIRYSSTIAPNNADVNRSVEYEYNSLNQVVREKVVDKAGNSMHAVRYRYDAANNPIEQIVDGLDGKVITTSYFYDADNKLIKIASPSGDRMLIYDDNGNLIDDGMGRCFFYDEKNRLVAYKSTKDQVDAEYMYYPNGMRQSKTVSGSKPICFYYDADGLANIVNEIQGDASSSYLMIGAKRYVRLVRAREGTEVQNYMQDHKDIVAIANQESQLEKTYFYEAYGQQREPQPRDESVGALSIRSNPFEYTSEYTDGETGLIYLRTRYYDPAIKRFISRDKNQLFNRYNYVDSNPVMFADPSGRGLPAVVAISALMGPVGLAISFVGLAIALVAGLTIYAINLSQSARADNAPKKNPSSESGDGGTSLVRAQAGDLFKRFNPKANVNSAEAQMKRAIVIAYPAGDEESVMSGGDAPGDDPNKGPWGNPNGFGADSSNSSKKDKLKRLRQNFNANMTSSFFAFAAITTVLLRRLFRAQLGDNLALTVSIAAMISGGVHSVLLVLFDLYVHNQQGGVINWPQAIVGGIARTVPGVVGWLLTAPPEALGGDTADIGAYVLTFLGVAWAVANWIHLMSTGNMIGDVARS
ncbi:RHS repeat domain-containing protein [Archangium lipolyticum]|uniref:RHS repeat domain-containing protein n=1 Tax=Archangium lipolyticum TaxID=2970465 RepID=UPI002149E71F|nr:RHS repeat-associated core domain-containing protein [Archangium lipolyticum]